MNKRAFDDLDFGCKWGLARQSRCEHLRVDPSPKWAKSLSPQGNRVKRWYAREHLRKIDVALQNADNLRKSLATAERAGDYRKAHALLLELKEVEPDVDLIESKLALYSKDAEHGTDQLYPDTAVRRMAERMLQKVQ